MENFLQNPYASIKEKNIDKYLCAEMLSQAITWYLSSFRPKHQQNKQCALKLLHATKIEYKESYSSLEKSKFDKIFDEVAIKAPTARALYFYYGFKLYPDKIRSVVVATLYAYNYDATGQEGNIISEDSKIELPMVNSILDKLDLIDFEMQHPEMLPKKTNKKEHKQGK